MKLYYLLGYKAVTPDFFSSMSFPGNIKGKFTKIASYATTQWGKHFGRLVFEVRIRQVACTEWKTAGSIYHVWSAGVQKILLKVQ